MIAQLIADTPPQGFKPFSSFPAFGGRSIGKAIPTAAVLRSQVFANDERTIVLAKSSVKPRSQGRPSKWLLSEDDLGLLNDLFSMYDLLEPMYNQWNTSQRFQFSNRLTCCKALFCLNATYRMQGLLANRERREKPGKDEDDSDSGADEPQIRTLPDRASVFEPGPKAAILRIGTGTDLMWGWWFDESPNTARSEDVMRAVECIKSSLQCVSILSNLEGESTNIRALRMMYQSATLLAVSEFRCRWPQSFPVTQEGLNDMLDRIQPPTRKTPKPSKLRVEDNTSENDELEEEGHSGGEGSTGDGGENEDDDEGRGAADGRRERSDDDDDPEEAEAITSEIEIDKDLESISDGSELDADGPALRKASSAKKATPSSQRPILKPTSPKVKLTLKRTEGARLSTRAEAKKPLAQPQAPSRHIRNDNKPIRLAKGKSKMVEPVIPMDVDNQTPTHPPARDDPETFQAGSGAEAEMEESMLRWSPEWEEEAEEPSRVVESVSGGVMLVMKILRGRESEDEKVRAVSDFLEGCVNNIIENEEDAKSLRNKVLSDFIAKHPKLEAKKAESLDTLNTKTAKTKKKDDPRNRPEFAPKPTDQWIAELTPQIEADPYYNFTMTSFNTVKLRNDDLQRELYEDVFVLGKSEVLKEYVKDMPRNGKAIVMGGIWRDRGAALFKENKLDSAREAWKRSIRYSLSEPEDSPLPHPTAFIHTMKGTGLDEYNDLIACANNIAQSYIKQDKLSELYLKMMMRWESVFWKLGNTSAGYATIHDAISRRSSMFRNADILKTESFESASKYFGIRHPDPRGAEGRLYVFGGEHYDGRVLGDGWVLNLNEMNGWRPVPGPPSIIPPIYHQPLVIHEGKGYLFQGRNTVRVFDFATETWDEVTTQLRNGDPWRKLIPKNYLIAFAAHLYNGKIYVFGGREEDGEYGRNVMMSLDIETLLWDVWSGTPDVRGDVTVPGLRGYPCSWITDDKFYITLGSVKRKDHGPLADYMYHDIWSFDLVSHKWTDEKFAGNGPCLRTKAAHTFNDNWKKALVFGGTYLAPISVHTG
ncbi:hypothetical protein FRC01_000509 [Tulasnella sp. 417]|nr:hypothetical protein FRC01_000509 [Tulasnella sp. 417]